MQFVDLYWIHNNRGHQSRDSCLFILLSAESEHTLRQQQEVIEDESSAERLTTLHARLHQEADKIRRWKLQTETELKQKV